MTSNGDWRYRASEDWLLDLLTEPENPEDAMIDVIDSHLQGDLDGGHGYTEPQIACLNTWMMNNLTEKEYAITSYYLFDGVSMSQLGDALGITRVRVWQIYKGALDKISDKACNDPDVFKAMFIGASHDEKRD